MADKTKIEWVVGPDGRRGITANPIRFRNLKTGAVGHHCTKISPGCANCYASRMQKPYLSGLAYTAENRDKGEFVFDESVIEKVLRLRTPTGIFWCDMTDLFGLWVPDEWIDGIAAVMALTPQHYHYVLTKRAGRMAGWAARPFLAGDVQIQANAIREVHRITFASILQAKVRPSIWWLTPEEKIDITDTDRWPLPNVRIGVSAEDQSRADERIPELMKLAAAGWKTFVSFEPLLGPIDAEPWLPRCGYYCDQECGHVDHRPGIGWCVVGGESGPGARPMHPSWVRSIRDQCIAAGVPFFFKQWGQWLPDDQLDDRVFVIKRGHPGAPPDMINKPVCHLSPGLHAFGVGKKRAGHLLDGREWKEFPEAAR